MRRMAGKADRDLEGKGSGQGDGWEGLCGTCRLWIPLGGGRRGGVPWFRHAYKVSLGVLSWSLGTESIMTAVSYAPQGAGHAQKETREQGREGLEDDDL